MADIFVEYMVKRKMTPVLRLYQILIIFAGFLALALAILLSPMAGALSFLIVLAGFAAVFAAWRLARARQVEFEYAVTNGEFDLDKIIARSSRKRILTFHCRDVEKLVPFLAGEKAPSGTILACSSLNDDNLWHCTVKHPTKGIIAFVFNASDPLLEAMARFLPGQVRRKALGNRL